MADQQTGKNEGVSRRQFLMFAGAGFAAGLAGMLFGNRLKPRRQAGAQLRVPEDSMFRPRDSARPQS